MRRILAFLMIAGLLLAACGGSGSPEGTEDASSPGEPGERTGGSSGLLATDPNSVAIVSTLAGSGEAGNQDGVGAAATFTQPVDVALGPDGDIYMVSFRGRQIARITPDGEVTTLALSEGTGDKDGPIADARFGNLRSLAVGDDGTVYFVDWENRKLKRLTPEGQVETVAEPGFMETMIFDQEGNLIAPAGGAREFVARITPAGEVSVLAGQKGSGGVTDGTLDKAKFSNLSGIALDEAGNIYLTQSISLRNKSGDQVIRMIDVDGNVVTIAGQRFQEGYQDGPGIDALFNYPVALAAAPNGTLFVADALNNCIRRVGPAPDYEVTTVAGACNEAGDLVDGEGTNARFKGPQGLVLSEDGVLYVADSLNNAIRKITFE